MHAVKMHLFAKASLYTFPYMRSFDSKRLLSTQFFFCKTVARITVYLAMAEKGINT